MITGIHAMFYSSDAAATRAFLRDKLGLKWCDVHDGWLIFQSPAGEIGCHPSDAKEAPPGMHDVSFTCDDVEKTVAELKGRGVLFDDAITDAGFGRTTHFTMPGGVKVMLYQPRYTLKFR